MREGPQRYAMAGPTPPESVTHFGLLGVHLLAALQPHLHPLRDVGAAHGLGSPSPDLINRLWIDGTIIATVGTGFSRSNSAHAEPCATFYLENVYGPCSTEFFQSLPRRYVAFAASLDHLNSARHRLWLRYHSRVHSAIQKVYRAMQFCTPKEDCGMRLVGELENQEQGF